MRRVAFSDRKGGRLVLVTTCNDNSYKWLLSKMSHAELPEAHLRKRFTPGRMGELGLAALF